MKSERVFLWGVLALAFGLRVTGIGYGLPDIYHQDEPILVNHAMAIGASGWNPHFFIIGPFTIYSLFLLYAAFFAVGLVSGVFADTNAFASAFLNDPSAFYLLGRFFLGALFGTATVVWVYRAGKRWFSAGTATCAALFLTVLPMHVQLSHFIYADIPLTFAVLLFFHCSLCLMEEPSDRNAFWVGAVAGWALSVKYTAAYFFPVAMIAHLTVWRSRIFSVTALKRTVIGAAAALGMFALIAPYTFLAWPEFRAQMAEQSGAQQAIGWWHHFGYSIAGGSSVLYTLFFAAGFISTLFSKNSRWLLAAAFFLSYYSVNVYFSQVAARYMLPLVPFTALWAAEGWRYTGERLKLGPGVRRFVLAAIVLELAATAFYGDLLLLHKDTRTEAAEWVEQNLPAGSVIALDSHFFTPHLKQTRTQILEKYAWLGTTEKDSIRKQRLDLELASADAMPAFDIYLFKPRTMVSQTPRFLFDGPYVLADAAALKTIDADYLILNFSGHGEAREEIRALLKTEFGKRLEKVAMFSPYWQQGKRSFGDVHATTGPPHLADELFSRKRLGPTLKIFKIWK